jgi:cystathionine beta-lyase
VFEPYQHLSIAAEFSEVRDRSITLLAPSKTFNVPGLSCGFAVIPNEALRQKLGSTAFSNGLFVNTLGYISAEAAYRSGQEWLDQVLIYLRSNRDFLLEYVEKKLPQAGITFNEGTYLAWIDFSAYSLPDTPFNFFLERAKVALNEGIAFGAGSEQYVRLNFGCARSVLQEALKRMCEAVAHL